MPVILEKQCHRDWLNPDFEEREQLLGMLTPATPEMLCAHSVSRRVNTPRYDDPKCLEPVSASERESA